MNLNSFRPKAHTPVEVVNVNGVLLPRKQVTQLEVNNFYVIKFPVINDETGEEEWGTDMAWFHEAKVVGDKTMKKTKLFRFCSGEKCLRFSQMIGMKMFGPLLIGGTDEAVEDTTEEPTDDAE